MSKVLTSRWSSLPLPPLRISIRFGPSMEANLRACSRSLASLSIGKDSIKGLVSLLRNATLSTESKSPITKSTEMPRACAWSKPRSTAKTNEGIGQSGIDGGWGPPSIIHMQEQSDVRKLFK